MIFLFLSQLMTSSCVKRWTVHDIKHLPLTNKLTSTSPNICRFTTQNDWTFKLSKIDRNQIILVESSPFTHRDSFGQWNVSLDVTLMHIQKPLNYSFLTGKGIQALRKHHLEPTFFYRTFIQTISGFPPLPPWPGPQTPAPTSSRLVICCISGFKALKTSSTPEHGFGPAPRSFAKMVFLKTFPNKENPPNSTTLQTKKIHHLQKNHQNPRWKRPLIYSPLGFCPRLLDIQNPTIPPVIPKVRIDVWKPYKPNHIRRCGLGGSSHLAVLDPKKKSLNGLFSLLNIM